MHEKQSRKPKFSVVLIKR